MLAITQLCQEVQWQSGNREHSGSVLNHLLTTKRYKMKPDDTCVKLKAQSMLFTILHVISSVFHQSRWDNIHRNALHSD